MRISPAACLGLLALLAVLGPLFRAQASPGLEGGSGLLSVPTAEVVAEGRAVFTMGRLLSRSLQTRGESIARSYNVTVGYLPGLEVVAKVNDYPLLSDSNNLANLQDRAVGGKYQLYDAGGWALAVGGVDIGGESQTQETYYGVATYSPSEEVSLTAGAGSGALRGPFGGLKYTPAEWLSLLGEYDTENFNYGVELRPFKGVTLKGGLVNDHGGFSASYSFPLDPRGQCTPCTAVHIERRAEDYAAPCAQAAAVRDALVCESFENVLAGVSGDTLYVEFENRRFREEVDAIGVALAVAAQHSGPGISRIVLSPKVEDIPQLTVSTGVDEYLDFLASPEAGACLSAAPYAPCYPEAAEWASEGNQRPGQGELLLRPLQTVSVGREGRAAWEASFGLELSAEAYLARGARMAGRGQWPILNDITEKTDPVARDLLLHLHQGFGPNIYATASTGYFGNGRTGASAEAAWYADGWKAGARWAYLQSDDAFDSEDGALLGELGYQWADLDWQMEAQAGQFMDGDQGLRVQSRRYFGPTELTFFAYDTDLGSPQGGVRMVMPLPWFGQGRHDAWRFGSAPAWPYQYRTSADPGGQLPPGVTLDDMRERLTPEYVAAHADWLRRAVYLWHGGG